MTAVRQSPGRGEGYVRYSEKGKDGKAEVRTEKVQERQNRQGGLPWPYLEVC